MKTNEDLQKDVQDAIKWEPLLKAAEIGVAAKDGVITLTGTVDTYAKKSEAEEATKHVAGVKAVVEQIDVQFSSLLKKTDNEIATDVLDAFNWNWAVSTKTITIKVEDGWVTLEGELEWNYQKNAAKTAIKDLAGVKGVTNLITIKSESPDEIEKVNIESALTRHWAIDGQDIQVAVSGSNVTLTGTVDSLYQKDEAGRIAWNAPGVGSVTNELFIDYDNEWIDKKRQETPWAQS